MGDLTVGDRQLPHFSLARGPARLLALPGCVLCARRHSQLFTAITLNSTGPVQHGCCGRGPRDIRGKSGGEASGNAASHLSTPRLGPGRAARTVAATTWLSGRSSLQHGLGDGERSFLESPYFWASGTGPQSSARGTEVGEAGERAAAGVPRVPAKPSALTPHGPPFPRACSGLVPGSGAPGHMGRREN